MNISVVDSNISLFSCVAPALYSWSPQTLTSVTLWLGNPFGLSEATLVIKAYFYDGALSLTLKPLPREQWENHSYLESSGSVLITFFSKAKAE